MSKIKKLNFRDENNNSPKVKGCDLIFGVKKRNEHSMNHSHYDSNA